MPTQATNESTEDRRVVVIGGGLAGLTAATYLARAGLPVTLFEKSGHLGGRATTQQRSGFSMNQGPHALYRSGVGATVLRDLGIEWKGRPPSVNGGFAVADGVLHTLPGGFVSLVTTGLLGLGAKLETAKLLAGIQRIDHLRLAGVSVRDWLDRTIRQREARQLVEALFRLSTYANAPEVASAGAAVHQLQLALASGVDYLDGGWQTLVDGLRAAAERAGAKLVSGQRVQAIELARHGATARASGAQLSNGESIRAAAVLIAADPHTAAALIPPTAHAGQDSALARWAKDSIPVDAACLDIALSRLPRPKALFGLGIDQPLYFSVHSAAAALAPAGAGLVHVAKYLRPDEPRDAERDERELAGVLDLMQPGWRELLVDRRFLPHMRVAHSVVRCADGGITARPAPAAPGIDGLFVAGDWVGSEGMLADASLASAREAARQVVSSISTAGPAAAVAA